MVEKRAVGPGRPSLLPWTASWWSHGSMFDLWRVQHLRKRVWAVQVVFVVVQRGLDHSTDLALPSVRFLAAFVALPQWHPLFFFQTEATCRVGGVPAPTAIDGGRFMTILL